MELSDRLYITPKGVEEITSRTFKLSIRKRSVLILLNKPQTVEHILDKTIFHSDEIIYEIQELLGEKFISLNEEGVSARPETLKSSSENHDLDDEIILSEAKFLLIDFCVDHFGTHALAFVENIRSCKSAKSLSLCLKNIFSMAEKQYPDELPALIALVKKINETV